MAVSIYVDGKWNSLAGNSVYDADNQQWKTIGDFDYLFFNNTWHKISYNSLGVVDQQMADNFTSDDRGEIPIGTIYYVSPNGNGTKDGLSFQNALPFQNFPVLLGSFTSLSSNNIHIFFAEGQYVPTQTIKLPTGVSLYGGFSLENTIWEARNPFKYQTKFIRKSDNLEFNYDAHEIWIDADKQNTSTQVIDGFYIKDYVDVITDCISGLTLKNCVMENISNGIIQCNINNVKLINSNVIVTGEVNRLKESGSNNNIEITGNLTNSEISLNNGYIKVEGTTQQKGIINSLIVAATVQSTLIKESAFVSCEMVTTDYSYYNKYYKTSINLQESQNDKHIFGSQPKQITIKNALKDVFVGRKPVTIGGQGLNGMYRNMLITGNDMATAQTISTDFVNAFTSNDIVYGDENSSFLIYDNQLYRGKSLQKISDLTEWIDITGYSVIQDELLIENGSHEYTNVTGYGIEGNQIEGKYLYSIVTSKNNSGEQITEVIQIADGNSGWTALCGKSIDRKIFLYNNTAHQFQTSTRYHYRSFAYGICNGKLYMILGSPSKFPSLDNDNIYQKEEKDRNTFLMTSDELKNEQNILIQVGTQSGWSQICGYSTLITSDGSYTFNDISYEAYNTYAYGICNGKLYMISGCQATLISEDKDNNNITYEWSKICGYSYQGSDDNHKTYAYGIRKGQLYILDKNIVSLNDVDNNTGIGQWIDIYGYYDSYNNRVNDQFYTLKENNKQYKYRYITYYKKYSSFGIKNVYDDNTKSYINKIFVLGRFKNTALCNGNQVAGQLNYVNQIYYDSYLNKCYFYENNVGDNSPSTLLSSDLINRKLYILNDQNIINVNTDYINGTLIGEGYINNNKYYVYINNNEVLIEDIDDKQYQSYTNNTLCKYYGENIYNFGNQYVLFGQNSGNFVNNADRCQFYNCRNIYTATSNNSLFVNCEYYNKNVGIYDDGSQNFKFYDATSSLIDKSNFTSDNSYIILDNELKYSNDFISISNMNNCSQVIQGSDLSFCINNDKLYKIQNNLASLFTIIDNNNNNDFYQNNTIKLISGIPFILSKSSYEMVYNSYRLNNNSSIMRFDKNDLIIINDHYAKDINNDLYYLNNVNNYSENYVSCNKIDITFNKFYGNNYCIDSSNNLYYLDGNAKTKVDITFNKFYGNNYCIDSSNNLYYLDGKTNTKIDITFNKFYGNNYCIDSSNNLYYLNGKTNTKIDITFNKFYGNNYCIDSSNNLYYLNGNNIKLISQFEIKNFYGNNYCIDIDNNLYYLDNNFNLVMIDIIFNEFYGNNYCTDSSNNLYYLDGNTNTKIDISFNKFYGNNYCTDTDNNLYYLDGINIKQIVGMTSQNMIKIFYGNNYYLGQDNKYYYINEQNIFLLSSIENSESSNAIKDFYGNNYYLGQNSKYYYINNDVVVEITLPSNISTFYGNNYYLGQNSKYYYINNDVVVEITLPSNISIFYSNNYYLGQNSKYYYINQINVKSLFNLQQCQYCNDEKIVYDDKSYLLINNLIYELNFNNYYYNNRYILNYDTKKLYYINKFCYPLDLYEFSGTYDEYIQDSYVKSTDGYLYYLNGKNITKINNTNKCSKIYDNFIINKYNDICYLNNDVLNHKLYIKNNKYNYFNNININNGILDINNENIASYFIDDDNNLQILNKDNQIVENLQYEMEQIYQYKENIYGINGLGNLIKISNKDIITVLNNDTQWIYIGQIPFYEFNNNICYAIKKENDNYSVYLLNQDDTLTLICNNYKIIDHYYEGQLITYDYACNNATNYVNFNKLYNEYLFISDIQINNSNNDKLGYKIYKLNSNNQLQQMNGYVFQFLNNYNYADCSIDSKNDFIFNKNYRCFKVIQKIQRKESFGIINNNELIRLSKRDNTNNSIIYNNSNELNIEEILDNYDYYFEKIISNCSFCFGYLKYSGYYCDNKFIAVDQISQYAFAIINNLLYRIGINKFNQIDLFKINNIDFSSCTKFIISYDKNNYLALCNGYIRSISITNGSFIYNDEDEFSDVACNNKNIFVIKENKLYYINDELNNISLINNMSGWTKIINLINSDYIYGICNDNLYKINKDNITKINEDYQKIIDVYQFGNDNYMVKIQINNYLSNNSNYCTYANCIGDVNTGKYNIYWNCDGKMLSPENAQSKQLKDENGDDGNRITLSTYENYADNSIVGFVDTGFAPSQGVQNLEDCPNSYKVVKSFSDYVSQNANKTYEQYLQYYFSSQHNNDDYIEYIKSFGDFHLSQSSILRGSDYLGDLTDLVNNDYDLQDNIRQSGNALFGAYNGSVDQTYVNGRINMTGLASVNNDTINMNQGEISNQMIDADAQNTDN